MRSGVLLAALAALAMSACSRPSAQRADAAFEESAASTGLNFHHFNGATGEWYMPEIVGPGVGLLDYDGDGDLDIFLAQGDFLEPGHKLADAKFPPPAGWQPGCRLFRNDLDGAGKLRFTDVTEAAGIHCTGMGMGVASADYDNDGHPDLLVTGFDRTTLYRNNGDGSFTDVTLAAGVADRGWSTSASFADYDRDGKLDLFLTRYLDVPLRKRQCTVAGGETDYCAPTNFKPLRSRLFHNEGGGRFRDVSEASHVASAAGPGLGVTAADFNGDGRTDFYVANDTAASYMWLAQPGGTFVESGLETGTAYDMNGTAQSGMGVAAADFDNHGAEDIFKTNLSRQGANLYRNNGSGIFTDAGAVFGLLAATSPYTGFGAGWFDFDNDGWLDLAIANGAVYIVEGQRGQPYPYRQPSQILHSDRGRVFRDVSAEASPALQRGEVGRGIAFGDIDNDGRVDFAIANNNGPVRLYLNRTGGAGHWLRVKLEGTRSNRDGAGSYVTVNAERGSPAA